MCGCLLIVFLLQSCLDAICTELEVQDVFNSLLHPHHTTLKEDTFTTVCHIQRFKIIHLFMGPSDSQAMIFMGPTPLGTGLMFYSLQISRWQSDIVTECQKHLYFTYLAWRAKFIAPHKLCLTEGGQSWHPFINLLKTHCCVSMPRWIFDTLHTDPHSPWQCPTGALCCWRSLPVWR